MESTQLLIKYNSLLTVLFHITYYCLFILIGILGYKMLTFKKTSIKLTLSIAIIGSVAFLAAMVISVLFMSEVGRIY